MTAKNRKRQLQEMLAEDPHDPFLRYGLAMEFVGEGNDTEAVRSLQELLVATPDYVPAYLQVGQALRRMGRISEARELFGRGITVAQQQGDTHAAEEMQGFLAALDE